MRIYLAGPINGCSDAECKEWREEAKRLLAGHDVVDPMARDYRGREGDNVAAIVEGDKVDVLRCDVVIANCPKPSFGTAMEILFAWERGRRVVVIASDPVSPWLRYHSAAISLTVAEAVRYLTGSGPPGAPSESGS